jgi:hypothetical protein
MLVLAQRAHVAGVKGCIELLKAAGRKETNLPTAAKSQHNAGLYAAVDDQDAKPAPEVAPLAAGTRIKITGLTAHARAAEYNGQPGVFLGFDRAGRCMVQLKNDKEMTIMREDIELVGGSLKGGFLLQVLKSGACGSTGARGEGRKTEAIRRMKGCRADGYIDDHDSDEESGQAS